jgi:hypothetical protein
MGNQFGLDGLGVLLLLFLTFSMKASFCSFYELVAVRLKGIFPQSRQVRIVNKISF